MPEVIIPGPEGRLEARISSLKYTKRTCCIGSAPAPTTRRYNEQQGYI